jgi:hypothetical protein
MYVAEIDQSGRIEETNRATVLALADGIINTLVIPRGEAYSLEALKSRRPKLSTTLRHVLVFSTLVFLLIKDHLTVLERVVIDLEYLGYEASIRQHILNLCRRRDLPTDVRLTFQQIGKKSPAHELAIQVYRGKVTARKTVTALEVLSELRGK